MSTIKTLILGVALFAGASTLQAAHAPLPSHPSQAKEWMENVQNGQVIKPQTECDTFCIPENREEVEGLETFCRERCNKVDIKEKHHHHHKDGDHKAHEHKAHEHKAHEHKADKHAHPAEKAADQAVKEKVAG